VNEERRLSAPGKVFLAGEYAVLDKGRPALVAAVDRQLSLSLAPLPDARVLLRHAPSGVQIGGAIWQGDASVAPRGSIAWEGSVPEALRFSITALEIASRLCADEGRPARGFAATFLDDLTLPTTAGAPPPPKLGLGGSAAACVLAVRAACAAHGRPLSPRGALSLALPAHWAAQGGAGSGADVAASALGGMLEVRTRFEWRTVGELLAVPPRALLEEPPCDVRSVAVPADLRLLLAFSGASADSRQLIREVRAWAAWAPWRWRHHVQALTDLAASLRDSLSQAAAFPAHSSEGRAARESALQAVRNAGAQMGALGAEAGARIVTSELARACGIASAAGMQSRSADLPGAAGKPSGAGGGDCAVVFAFGDAVCDAVEAALQKAGFPVFRIAAAPPAVADDVAAGS
jgi:phosphomevalonate kinase